MGWTIPRGQEKHLGRLVSGALAGYTPGAESSVDKIAMVREFLAIPSRVLITTEGRNWRQVLKQRLINTKKAIVDMIVSADEVATTTGARPQQKTRSEASRVAAEVTTKTRAGFPGRGMDVLMRATERKQELSDEAKLAEMQRLHPAPLNPNTPHLQVNKRVMVVSSDEFTKQAVALCRGKSPAASGWTEELVAAAALGDKKAATLMAHIVTDLVNDDCPEVATELTMSRLVAIPKPDKPGEARPIGVGEALLKIAAAIQLKKCGSQIDEEFGETQFVLRDCGAEQIIHQIRADVRGGRIVAALDASNAFNTIERTAIADAILKRESADHLRGIFNTTYHRHSVLRFFKKMCGFFDIKSRRGVRQGDPLGPVLYALGTLDVLLKVKAAFPDLRIVAFADDIFITGENEARVKEAIDMIAAELEKIGVKLNLGKTRIIGRDGDPSGLVILGAWCGAPGSSEQFLETKLRHYQTFFDALDGTLEIDEEPIRLPADVAFSALVQAGHARWTYIARTHPPEDEVTMAHSKFDDMMLQTLRGIAGVNTLPKHSQLIATLPIRDGGLGLAPFKVIGSLAYKASAGIVDASQKALTIAFYDLLRSELDKQLVDHLRAWKHKHGSMWLRKHGALEDASCPVTHGFGGALRLRLGLHLSRPDWIAEPSITTSCPGCGALMPGIAAARAHAVKCANWASGFGPTNRHHLLRDSLISVLQDTGATVSREVQIDANRMDIIVSSTEGGHYWLDVGITHERSGAAMSRRKNMTYASLAQRNDAEFHALVFNGEGRPTAGCKRALLKLSCDFDVPMSRLMAAAVGAIMCGNGLIVSKAESFVRSAIGKRPSSESVVVPTAPVKTKSLAEILEDARLAEELPLGRDLVDEELRWVTRAVPKGQTVSPTDEAGAASTIAARIAVEVDSDEDVSSDRAAQEEQPNETTPTTPRRAQQKNTKKTAEAAAANAAAAPSEADPQAPLASPMSGATPVASTTIAGQTQQQRTRDPHAAEQPAERTAAAAEAHTETQPQQKQAQQPRIDPTTGATQVASTNLVGQRTNDHAEEATAIAANAADVTNEVRETVLAGTCSPPPSSCLTGGGPCVPCKK